MRSIIFIVYCAFDAIANKTITICSLSTGLLKKKYRRNWLKSKTQANTTNSIIARRDNYYGALFDSRCFELRA